MLKAALVLVFVSVVIFVVAGLLIGGAVNTLTSRRQAQLCAVLECR